MTAWLLALLMSIAGAAVPQNVEPRLRITEPADGSYQMGDLVIRASVEPASQRVQQMTFFADTRLLCTVDRPPFECPWNAGPKLEEHTVWVVALLPGGRRLTTRVHTKKTEVNDAVEVNRVQVTVSVLDGARFVTGLPHEAFRVFEDDKRQRTTFFQPGNSALDLVVAADVSESMTLAIDGLKENVKRFLSSLRPTDRVTVAAFNHNHFLVSPPGVNLAARLESVDSLSAWGMTSLYEMVLRSFEQLGTQAGRRALVIFSDGEDTSSRVPREAIEKRAQRNDAVIYTIGQGKVGQSPALRTLCEQLSVTSGGRAFFPKDLAGLAAAFDSILDELSNQYLLSYEPPSTSRDGKWHRLRVEVNGRYDVRAPQGYATKAR